MDNVKLRKTGKFHVKLKMKQHKIIEQVKQIPELTDLKNDRYLLTYIACCVLEEIKEKYFKKVSFEDVVLHIYQQIFTLTVPEIEKLKQDLKFGLSEKLIFKRKMIVRYSQHIYNFFLKAFGVKKTESPKP